MDFQDRFRDRSCLITKNGLQSIISAPGNPIQKSNTSLGPSFFIPHGHMRNISHEFQGPKPQAANPSNTLCDNSIYSTFSRLPHSRQSPAGRARPRIIPLNGLGFPQNTWFDRLPREKEIEKDPRIETSNGRVPSLRAIEQGVESFYRGSKTARLKEKSIDVSKSRRETDYRDDSIPTVENERLGVNRSQDGKENKRWMENFANRMAMGPMRRGISVETFGNKRELMEYSNPGTMRMKNLFPQNDVGERRSVYNNILPQLEKVYHYDASSSKAVLASFREKTSQGSGYLIEHFNKVDVSNNLDQKRPVTKGFKTRSCDKVPKEVEMEESEILKRNRKDSREMKITSQAKAARKIRLNTLQREVEPEFQKLIKKVSFREGAEMIAGRNGSKQKEMRFAVGKRVRSENRE